MAPLLAAFPTSLCSPKTSTRRVGSMMETTRLFLSSLPHYPSSEKNPSGLSIPSRPNLLLQNIMAPMVAASDAPFRKQVRNYGADLCYTQMLHARHLVHDASFRKYHLDFGSMNQERLLLKGQLDCLGRDGSCQPMKAGSQKETRPLIVQLAGNHVATVVQAATLILEHTEGNLDGIDLNLGCPQGIARKGNYGAFLMDNDFERVCEILTALRQALPSTTAVTAKIRLPTTDTLLRERIPRLLDTGIHYLTVHGRTRLENKTLIGACHIDRLRYAVELAQKHTPGFQVVANGGVEDFEDVAVIREQTGAVAIMSSEALLELPNVFQQSSRQLSPRQRVEQQLGFANEYLDICEVEPPLPGLIGSFNVVRGHLFKFLYPYLQDQTDLRSKLADSGRMLNLVHARSLLEELEQRYASMSDQELLQQSSSNQPSSSWYRRHRNSATHRKRQAAKEPVVVSVEERKRQMKERIAKLKASRIQKITKPARVHSC